MSGRPAWTSREKVDVGVSAEGFVVRLDDKPLTTPRDVLLALPSRALAEAIADEWRCRNAAKKEAERPKALRSIDPDAMPLTRLAFAAVDAVAAHRQRIRDEVLAYGRTDLLCYRAEGPAELVAAQARGWDPLLGWAKERYGAELAVGRGIRHVAQPEASLGALAAAVAACDDFALAGLRSSAALTGSLVLALALAEGRLAAPQAFALSRIDETFQAEMWGPDAEAEARADRVAGELEATERFLRLALSRP